MDMARATTALAAPSSPNRVLFIVMVTARYMPTARQYRKPKKAMPRVTTGGTILTPRSAGSSAYRPPTMRSV
jgi:hypothetical protein